MRQRIMFYINQQISLLSLHWSRDIKCTCWYLI